MNVLLVRLDNIQIEGHVIPFQSIASVSICKRWRGPPREIKILYADGKKQICRFEHCSPIDVLKKIHGLSDRFFLVQNHLFDRYRIDWARVNERCAGKPKEIAVSYYFDEKRVFVDYPLEGLDAETAVRDLLGSIPQSYG